MNNKINPKLSGIAIKLLAAYVEWQQLTRHIPKMQRYSLGIRLDGLFAELIEMVAKAQFELKDKRFLTISQAVVKNDTLKFMLYVLLELQGLDQKKFLSLSLKMEEVGRMLYGWRNQSVKQNRPADLILRDGNIEE